MMSCYEICRKIRSAKILFSLRWNVELILQGRTLSLYSKFFCGVFGGGTCLAMLKTTLHAGLIIIEAWFRGY